jgi:hypothetical protein
MRDFFVASNGKPQGRRKKGTTPLSAAKSGAVQRETAVENLVKAGVERFILENATMDEFLRTLRIAGEPESLYAHQLTGSVLSRIVRQAIHKRKSKRRKTARR